MKKTTFRLSLVAVVAVAAAAAFASGNFIHHAISGDRDLSHTAWKDNFATPEELVEGVDLIVHATMVGTSPGRVAYSDDPNDFVPFELNRFVVRNVMKGDLAPGASVTVERVGGVLAGQRVQFDSDGGDFEQARDYVLFLKKQPETGYYYQVNDEGRYLVDDGRRLVRVAEQGAASAEISGKTVSDLRAFVSDVARLRAQHTN